MATSPGVAYNPNDPIQQSFLSSLALGETGNSAFASSEGVGGQNLSADPTDPFGFPVWGGQGQSHAAGIFQFEPKTWDAVAREFNLNFKNPQDQAAGAWDYAQQVYASNTGGQDLETALQSGQYQSVQDALKGVWPSVVGNVAAPMGLARDLGAGVGANVPGPSTDTGFSIFHPITSTVNLVENLAERGALVVIGAIVILVALWMLLSNQGIVPSPKDVAKGAAAAIAA